MPLSRKPDLSHISLYESSKQNILVAQRTCQRRARWLCFNTLASTWKSQITCSTKPTRRRRRRRTRVQPRVLLRPCLWRGRRVWRWLISATKLSHTGIVGRGRERRAWGLCGIVSRALSRRKGYILGGDGGGVSGPESSTCLALGEGGGFGGGVSPRPS
jgi:hypothetical protein